MEEERKMTCDKKNMNGEREINTFTFYESIDYVIDALNDGKYQDAYKSYLTEVLEHIRNLFPEPQETE